MRWAEVVFAEEASIAYSKSLMNTTSPTFVTAQVGRNFLTLDDGEGDHN